jgi:dolichol-phosphate mannosyltransferase
MTEPQSEISTSTPSLAGWVMMATYNEASNIEQVLLEVVESAAALEPQGITVSVLLVDDQSPDGTAEIARRVASANGLRLLVVSGEKAGLGTAVLRGFGVATTTSPTDGGQPADFIVTLDADRQHDARQIPALLEAFLARKSGILIGSRWTKGGASPGTSLGRTVISRGGNLLFRMVTGTRYVRDATTSFRVIRPEVAAAFQDTKLQVGGYAFFSSFIAVTQASGWTVHEAPIVFRPRGGGQSKLTGKDCVEFVTNLFTIRTTAKELRRQRKGRRAARPATNNPALIPASGRTEYDAATFGATAELESLSRARRAGDWFLDEIEPLLGNRIVEFGAGIGSVTREIRRLRPHSYVLAVESSRNLARPLLATGKEIGFDVHLHYSGDLAAQVRQGGGGLFDTAIFSKRLEHVQDDAAELRLATSLIQPGGTVVALVPATPWAYGSIDHISGHFRRYRKDQLSALFSGAGLDLVSIKYVDVIGLIPYWFVYRLLRFTSLREGHIRGYDRLLIPVSRAVQRRFPEPPIGKNLIAVGTKKAPR